MNRVLLTAAACAFTALVAAGCEPPVEGSEFNNSGLSAAVAYDASAVPQQPANPPPRIEAPPRQASASEPSGEPKG